MLKIVVLTLFPEAFPGSLGVSILKKALTNKLWELNIVNIRDFATDKHKTVDDKPFGGGCGMVMRPDVLGNAIEYCENIYNISRKIYMSPQGKILTSSIARDLINYESILIICGRYEGIDDRLIKYYNIEEISIGNYVLAGGEVAAQVLIESSLRFVHGVIENDKAVYEESFGIADGYNKLLEYPQYTKPEKWKNISVPSILISGNHEKIRQWKMEESKKCTREKRPDLGIVTK